jgi:hypothetical protein
VNQKAYKNAMVAMRDTHNGAVAVLVLDEEQMWRDHPSSVLEILARITHCAWDIRLSTFQDRALSCQLNFAFLDGQSFGD